MLRVWDSTSTAGFLHIMWYQDVDDKLWRENRHGGWATFFVLVVILIWHCCKRFSFRFSSSTVNRTSSDASIHPHFRMSEIISHADLKFLIKNLDQMLFENEKWEHVIDKRNAFLTYNAPCCKPKDGPMKYLSETVFENCSPKVLIDFYMDNEYRKQWDKTLVEHEQLQVDTTTGVEIGRTVKKFPLLTPREYILAWRLWEGKHKTCYCFVKECEHPSTPRHKKYVRVRFFRSGWRIRKVPGRNACEIKMFHHEDAGFNTEIAKLAFAKGIWSYVCKMDNALRKYSAISHPQSSSAVTALTLIQKISPGLDTMEGITESPGASMATTFCGEVTSEAKERKSPKRASRKLLANGLLLVVGAICLSRGHSSLGAKVAMAYILTKLRRA